MEISDTTHKPQMERMNTDIFIFSHGGTDLHRVVNVLPDVTIWQTDVQSKVSDGNI